MLVNAGEPGSAIEIRGCRCFQWNSHSVLWLRHQSSVSGWEGIYFITVNLCQAEMLTTLW